MQFAELAKTRLPVDRSFTVGLALGDVDGDADLDIVCGNFQSGQNRLYLNDGDGSFTDATPSHMPRDSDGTESVALGDVDGDGDLDIVVANSRQNRLYLNDGQGRFRDVTRARMPIAAYYSADVRLGDVDGDRDLDIVFGVVATKRNRLYLNDGNGAFTDVTTNRMPNRPADTQLAALGDVDGDGDLDIVCGNFLGQQNRLYVNDGKGTFRDVTSTHLPVDTDSTNGLAVGDVDGDGDLDIVCGNSARGSSVSQDRLYLNDGSGKFADVTRTHMPPDSDSTEGVVLHDLDGDGDPDLLLGNTSLRNRVYLNDGGGRFTDVTSARLPNHRGAWEVAAGDVDGDGDPDLVVGNAGPNRLYLNLHRHAYAPSGARIGQAYGIDYHARPGYAPSGQRVFALVNAAGLTPPVRIGPFGLLRVSPVGLIALPPRSVPSPGGTITLSLAVPNNPWLIGKTIFTQAVVAHGSNPLTWRFTNLTDATIRR